ncbi:MAG: phospholipase D-like domain-containing protein [Pseudomonadota bacterium]|nr:phospholipase D-like domain-containing protein [Pseudomonadota bacterium]
MKPVLLLPRPTHIDKSLGELLATSTRVDVGVAFLGQDAPKMLEAAKNLRLVCWLDSGATSPAAVVALQKVTAVRHASGMHAKVVIGYGKSGPRRAIVGSANLSRAALGRDTVDSQGRFEVAVVVEDPGTLLGLSEWFEQLWNDPLTKEVDDAALQKAEAAWNRRRKERKEQATEDESTIPHLKNLELFEIALEWARSTPLIAAIGHDAVEFASRIDPATITKAELDQLLRYLAEWYPDIGVVRQSLDEPLATIRGSFKRMTDTTEPIVDRLRLEMNAPNRLRGFGVAIWSTVLYWRDPENTPPLNQRSHVVAAELGRADGMAKQASATTYGRWLLLAEELRQEWALPTLGHVDRVVYAYTEGLTGQWPRPVSPADPTS